MTFHPTYVSTQIEKNQFIQGKNHARALSLLLTKGTIIPWHHLVQSGPCHLKNVSLTLGLSESGPKGSPAPAFSRHQKPFLLGAPSRRLLNP